MPDFQNFSITGRPDQALTVNVIRVQGQIRNSQTQALIQDFTGANAIDFALLVPGFSAQDHRDLVEKIWPFILRRRAGLE